MGCFWSSEEREQCYSCGRHAVNNLVIRDHLCECCRSRKAQQEKVVPSNFRLLERGRERKCSGISDWPDQPLFGEYRCPCGRFWSSCLSWRNKYQNCKKCGRQVTASYQRELRPTDLTEGGEKRDKHAQELCKKCQELGKFCGIYRQGVPSLPSSNGFKGRRGPRRPRAHSTRKY